MRLLSYGTADAFGVGYVGATAIETGWDYLTQSARGYANPGGRQIIPDPWEVPIVSGVLVGVTPELQADIDSTDSTIASLKQDIDTYFMSIPTVATDPQYIPLTRLKIDYDTFVAQFDAWYAEGQGFFNNSWSLGASQSLSDFKAQYQQFRQRAVTCGVKPTSDLASPPSGPGGLPSWALPVAIIGGFLFLVAPLVGVLLGGPARASR